MTAPRMRAGHADRQTTVDRLARHFTDGRLEASEFDERVGRAYAATYLDELPELSADLPEEEARRGPGARRPVLDGSGQFGPVGRPGPWGGPHRRPHHGPARFMAVFVAIAVIFSISALAHGFFPVTLIWVAVVLLLLSRGSRRRRWAESGYDRHR